MNEWARGPNRRPAHQPEPLRVLVTCDGGRLRCDVGTAAPGLALVDRLARLQLLAARRGIRMEIVNVSADLRALLELTGMAEVLESALESRGEPEERKQPVRVEEPVQPGDPSA